MLIVVSCHHPTIINSTMDSLAKITTLISIRVVETLTTSYLIIIIIIIAIIILCSLSIFMRMMIRHLLTLIISQSLKALVTKRTSYLYRVISPLGK